MVRKGSPSSHSPALPRAHAAIAAALALSAPACAGNAKASAYWSAETVEQVHPRETEVIEAPVEATKPPEAPKTLFGVRHDLRLVAQGGALHATCSCIAAAAGDASDARFRWDDKPADAGPDALVFAMSDEGVECAAASGAADGLRPSISAVDQVNGDVVIEIENVPDGRPVAWGAIIPRPDKGGGVYLKPRSAKLPFARPLAAGAARCKVD